MISRNYRYGNIYDEGKSKIDSAIKVGEAIHFRTIDPKSTEHFAKRAQEDSLVPTSIE